MPELFQQFFEVGTGIFLLCLLTIPTGWLFLRLSGLVTVSWTHFAIASVVGMLLLPLSFNLLGLLGILNLSVRIALWAGLNFLLLAAQFGLKSAVPEKENRLHSGLVIIGLIAAFLTLFPLVLHDVPIEGRWTYVMAGDWGKHIPVVTALAVDDSLPPHNPFLSTEPELRYYYFAYILPGMISHLSGISVTNSLIALAVLVAFTFPVLLYQYGKEAGLSVKVATGVVFLVTLVSGLDFLYVLLEWDENGRKTWPEHIDFWTNHDLRRINSISDMFIWTPQHILGVAAFLLILWWIHRLMKANRQNTVLLTASISLILSALSGTSSFVWFGVMSGMAVYISVEILRALYLRQPVKIPLLLILASGFSLILSLPYLNMVGQRQESAFAISISPTVSDWLFGGIFSDLFGANQLTYALDFPLQMLPEFGVVLISGLPGIWVCRREILQQPEKRLWAILLPVFFFIVLAVRPDRPDSNNYAARVAPLAWVLLGIFSGFWWMKAVRKNIIAALLSVMVIIGLCSTLYEPFIQQGTNYMALFNLNTDFQRHNPRFNFVSDEEYELYTWLNQHLERDDVYQMGYEWVPATFFVERRAGVAAGYLALLYVSYPELYYVHAIGSLETGYKSTSPQDAAAAFLRIGVNYVVTSKIPGELAELDSQNDPMFTLYFQKVFENERFTVYYLPG